MDLSVSLTRDLLGMPGSPLEINDHTNYYVSELGDNQVTWRRQTTSSPWVDGTVTTNRSKENITRSLSIEVLGDDWPGATANAKALIDTISQDNFIMTLNRTGGLVTYTGDDLYLESTIGPEYGNRSLSVVNNTGARSGYLPAFSTSSAGNAFILAEIASLSPQVVQAGTWKYHVSTKGFAGQTSPVTISGGAIKHTDSGDVQLFSFDPITEVFTTDYAEYILTGQCSAFDLNSGEYIVVYLNCTSAVSRTLRTEYINTYLESMVNSVALPTPVISSSYLCEASDYSWVQSKERWHSNRGILTVSLIHKPNPITGDI